MISVKGKRLSFREVLEFEQKMEKELLYKEVNL